MKRSSLTFQYIVDTVNKYVADNGSIPTHVFVDYISFAFIMRDVNRSTRLSIQYNSMGQKTRGACELVFHHKMGKATLKSVNYKSKFVMVGYEKTYLDYVVEKEFLGVR